MLLRIGHFKHKLVILLEVQSVIDIQTVGSAAVATGHRVAPAHFACERVHVPRVTPVVRSNAVWIGLIVTLHGCAVVAVIWPHIMVALCVGQSR